MGSTHDGANPTMALGLHVEMTTDPRPDANTNTNGGTAPLFRTKDHRIDRERSTEAPLEGATGLLSEGGQPTQPKSKGPPIPPLTHLKPAAAATADADAASARDRPPPPPGEPRPTIGYSSQFLVDLGVSPAPPMASAANAPSPIDEAEALCVVTRPLWVPVVSGGWSCSGLLPGSPEVEGVGVSLAE
ncbi:hypothetical protein G7Z17_g7778 [Cylindrodendrum hubeiense]|uniref:Uncharacterized protein n=1 Tax=Cylindrodendrum hubeiense TaxID=595255 RepID=A0A9P5H9W1_9HYPO|nr:hypothetical protein G7Z17_g7778 [Cylindrodendrum hubeiense]